MDHKSLKRLVLLDAHAILHRAYHALPDFSSSRGEPTGALYGLSTMIIRIISELKPDYIVGAFDLPKPTYRHEAYKDYKAGRAKADDALIAQMKRARDVFTAFQIPVYDKEGFEADDMIGTIVETLKKEKNLDIVIASGDMDTLQLVSGKRVQVFTLKKGINDTILYDETAVKERYGFGPEFLPDFKGLKGDPSDNIIGIKGIGDKTATILIQKFGTIEKMYKALKKGHEVFLKAGITERIIGLLEAGKEEAEFSKMLGTIRLDAPIDFSLPEKTWKETFDLSIANILFTELEFRGLPKRLSDALEKIRNSKQKTNDSKLPATSYKPPATSPHQPSFNEAVQGENVPPQELAETAIALWLVNSNITNPTLDDILGFARTRDWKKARDIVYEELKKRNLVKIFEIIEKPLVSVVRRMNERGVGVDVSFLKKLSIEYHTELSKREKAIWKVAGEEFNVASPKQLGEIIFNKLSLKAKNQKKTAGGALSTRESELEKLRDLHPIIGLALEYREFAKLLSTYIDTIPTLVDDTGRLHANFLQAGTTTGRMGSEKPNLQNIPNHTDLGKRIRHAFVSAPKYSLVAIDYSQIELRVAAFLSGDEKFIEIFKSGEDVHMAVASEVFGIPRNEVTKEMRRQAKAINFGMLYGMGVNSLRQSMSGPSTGSGQVTREEAETFYKKYFTRFSRLTEYLEEVKGFVRKNGYTETFFGRRRTFEAINSKIPFIRASAERMAINAPIQGTQSDIIKLAMVRIDEFLEKEGLHKKAGLILQVHDELVYEIEEGLVSTLVPKIKQFMESVLTLEDTKGVPIVVDASVGKNWGELKKVS